MNFKGISYIKWINLNWKKKVTHYFISEHILVRRWSIAFGGNLPIDVAPWHCYSSHLMSGDYVHSLVAIESKIPAWTPRIVMIQQVITSGTKPGGPGSRTRDEALQIVMHYSCTILAKNFAYSRMGFYFQGVSHIKLKLPGTKPGRPRIEPGTQRFSN